MLAFPGAACGPSTTEAFDNCDEAFQLVRKPTAPSSTAHVRPVEVGSELPLLRADHPRESPLELASRTFAAACVFDPAASTEDGLLRWATDASEGADLSAFLLRTSQTEARYDADSKRLTIKRVTELSAPVAADAIGWTVAETMALDVLANLQALDLANNATHQLMFVTRGTHEEHCTEETPECRAEVRSHRFSFAPTYAGLPIPASAVEIVIGWNGDIRTMQLTSVDLQGAGTSLVAELSEADALVRIADLSAQEHPGSELHWEQRGLLQYSVPIGGSTAKAEPVLYGRFIPDDARPIDVSLPLSDANAELTK
ncbi:MAG: hypothetical protein ACRBN8_46905 [Nannocystales bacterium]